MAATPDDVTPENLGSFRGLYELLANHEGTDVFADVLLPAIPSATKLMEPLRRYRKRQPEPAFPNNEDWDFFALSVVNDCLRLPLVVSEKQYLHFFEALGFSPFRVKGPFNPIRHEIVQVSNHGKPEEGIEVWGSGWPGLMWGDLVFSRAATGVLCHRDHRILADIADRSTLYSTNRRFNRHAYDASHGWGSNSRWRTRFRFDYDEPEQLLFRVHAGEVDLADPVRAREKLPPDVRDYELSLELRRELLVHRCFVSHDNPQVFNDRGGDWYIVYQDDVLAVRRADVLWPLSESVLLRQDEVKPPSP